MDEEIKDLNGKEPVTESANSTANKDVTVKKERWGLRWLAVIVSGLVIGAVIAVVFIAVTTGKKKKKNVMNSDVVSELDETTSGKRDDDKVGTTENVSSTMKVSSSDFSDIASNILPSVVAIECTVNYTSSYDDLFGFDFGFGSPSYSTEAIASGTGFIIGQNGDELLIATNNHVVDGAKKVSVEFIDGTKAEATVKGTDAFYDVAVLSLDMDQLKDTTLNQIRIATIGSSDEVKVGDMSIAIGNSLGYGQSITVGYISALDRDVKTEDGTTMQLMQTDTVINHGNSGGPLLNIYGEVIGITSAKYGSYSSGKVEGMGFAIPISKVIPIINELMNRVEISSSDVGYLGIEGKEVSESYAKAFGMPKGLYVYAVDKDSAADKAGIKAGDIITSINGRSINTMDDLKNILSYKKYDTEIEVTYSTLGRSGYTENTITVKLGKKSMFNKGGSN